MNACVSTFFPRLLNGHRRSLCSCIRYRQSSHLIVGNSHHRTKRVCFSSDRNNETGLEKDFTNVSSLSQHDLDLTLNELKTEDKSGTFIDIPGSERGGKKLAIIYTCKVCNTRGAKKFTEQAYRNGLVMIRCPGCQNLHLIADRLGVFDDSPGGWDIQKYLESIGETVKSVTNDDVLEITMADIIGNNASNPSKDKK